MSSLTSEGLQERLVTMQEQILSRSKLQPLIESFDLYKEDRAAHVPMEELVERIRASIKVNVLRPAITAKPGTVPGFTVSYTGDSPQQAHDMCSQITGLFIEENLKVRESRAKSTTQFIETNLDGAKKILEDKDQKLAALDRKSVV